MNFGINSKSNQIKYFISEGMNYLLTNFLLVSGSSREFSKFLHFFYRFDLLKFGVDSEFSCAGTCNLILNIKESFQNSRLSLNYHLVLFRKVVKLFYKKNKTANFKCIIGKASIVKLFSHKYFTSF